MDIQWVFDEDIITVGDVVALQDGTMAERMNTLAKCAFDPQTEQPLPQGEVVVYLHSLSIKRLKQLLEAVKVVTQINDPN